MSGWYNLLVPLLGWESPNIGMRVNLLQDSSGIVIVYEPVVFWSGSELGSPLWDLIDSKIWPPVGLQSIVDIRPGSRISYPDWWDLPRESHLRWLLQDIVQSFPQPTLGCASHLPHDLHLLWIFLGCELLSLRGGVVVETATRSKAIRK